MQFPAVGQDQVNNPELIQRNYPEADNQVAEESKCMKTAKKVGQSIKNAFLKYVEMWKDLFGTVKTAWKIDKGLGVVQAFAITNLALLHLLSLTMLVAGVVFLSMGTGGAGLLVGGLVLTPFTFVFTALKFID